MTPPDAVATRKHRELAADALLQVRPLSSNVLAWIENGDERLLLQSPSGGYPFTLVAPRTAQSLANLEAAVRREYEARIAELEESLEMACQNPADGCDCPGCSYAAEVNSTELETLKNG